MKYVRPSGTDTSAPPPPEESMWVSKKNVSVSDEWPLFKYVKEKIVSKVVAQMTCLVEYFVTNSPYQIIVSNTILQEPTAGHLETNESIE